MSDIRKLLESMNKFAGEPEQKPGDQVRGHEKAKKSDKHPFLKRLVGEMKATGHQRSLKKEFAMFKENQEIINPSDKVTMDIPLLIRLFEFAREDAKSDQELHIVTEKLIALSAHGGILTMKDYDQIVTTSDVAEQIMTPNTTPPGGMAAQTTPNAVGGTTQNPSAVAQLKAQQLKQVQDQKKQLQDQIKQTQDQLAALRKQLADASNPANIAIAEQNQGQ